MRNAVVNADNEVVNVIEAEADFDPGEGLRLVRSDKASPGEKYEGGKFIAPEGSALEPTPRERYAAATTQAQKLAILAEHAGLAEG